MSNYIQDELEHDSAFEKLPWYVNETLEPSDRTAVSRHIGQCVDCQREVEFLAAMNDFVRIDARDRLSEHANIENALSDVLGRIDAEVRQPKQPEWPAWLNSVKRNLAEIFAFPPTSGAQWSAAALTGILVAVLAVTTFIEQPDDDYSVLSSVEDVSSVMQIAVSFASGTNQSQAESLLESTFNTFSSNANIEIIADDSYVVTFKESLEVEELGAIVKRLESDAQIEQVEISAAAQDQ